MPLEPLHSKGSSGERREGVSEALDGKHIGSLKAAENVRDFFRQPEAAEI